MNNLVLICLLLISTMAFGVDVDREVKEERLPSVIPQAVPVADWIKAVLKDDIGLYRTVWSSELFVREGVDAGDLADEDWQEALDFHKETFESVFGEYDLADFSFRYEGDEKKGAVIVKFKDMEPDKLQVVKDGLEWKLNEVPGE